MTSPEAFDLSSMDMAEANRAKLKALFPSVFTEIYNENGELIESVDFEKLKAELGKFSDIFESRRERYGMEWPGKKEALRLIQQPSYATLKPCRDESVNFDTTENLFIEGDNLEVLKLLQKSYYGNVKMIYIDPPYNTGKEFIYPDDYKDSLKNYLAYARLVDDEGRKFSTNTTNEGRFHTKWLNMMYPRLYLARNLLRKDGVIFISIDDNEVSNLRKLCDDIFSEENFLIQFTWKTDGNFDNQAKFKNCHEYILGYAKSINDFPHPPVIDPNTPKDSKLFKEEIRNTIVKNGSKNPISEIILPIGFPADIEEGKINKINNAYPHYLSEALIENNQLKNEVTVSSGWSSKDLLEQFISNGCEPIYDSKLQETTFTISQTGAIEAIKKRSDKQSHVLSVLFNLGGSQKASTDLENLGVVFDNYPKPKELLKYLIQMNEGTDFYVIDFFSGSCSTAHAVSDLNKEDGGNRKFIMVQLPEPCEEKSEAKKAGYDTIADIGKERIRRAIQKIEGELDKKEGENQSKIPELRDEMPRLDLGFKVLKLNASNFNTWQGNDPEIEEGELMKQLELHIDHIKTTATQEDILYELLLKSGFMPTEKVETLTLADKTVYSISDGALLICLESQITRELINAIAEKEPLQFICLDQGFQRNDQLKANAVQTFNAHNQGKDTRQQILFRTV